MASFNAKNLGNHGRQIPHWRKLSLWEGSS